MEDEFRDCPDVGIVIQCYLSDAGDDLSPGAIGPAARHAGLGAAGQRRLLGLRNDPRPRRHGWPIPVFQQKWESDANFERLTRFLMRNIASCGPPWPATTSARWRMAWPWPGISAAADGLRAANALRHGRRRKAGLRRPGLSPADLHALRRTDSRHGLPGPPAVGKHVERFVFAGEFHRTRRRGEIC